MSSDTSIGARSTIRSHCIARIRLWFKTSLLLLLCALCQRLLLAPSTAWATPLYPDLSIEPAGSTMPNQLSLTRLWFSSPLPACSTGLDTLSVAWLQARLIALCPYVHGRTSFAAEVVPELQWPSGETLNEEVRPGLRLAHLQNTSLSRSLTHFFRISYKFALEPSQQTEDTERPTRLVSVSLLQEWADFTDAIYETGLILRLKNTSQETPQESWDRAPEEEVLFSFLQTLPLAVREWSLLRTSPHAKWAQLSMSYRRSSGLFQWGIGMSYGSLSFDRVHLAGLFPTFHMAVLLGSPSTESRGG